MKVTKKQWINACKASVILAALIVAATKNTFGIIIAALAAIVLFPAVYKEFKKQTEDGKDETA